MRRWAFLAVLPTTTLLLSGCFLLFQHSPPEKGKPAATVGFRVNHMYYPGGRLVNKIQIDGKWVAHRAPVRGAATVSTAVKPGWRHFTVYSYYRKWRSYPRLVTETKSYPCGSSYCSRTVTRTVYYRRYYRVGYCKRTYDIHTANGHTYTLDYRHAGTARCALTCYRQAKQPDGTFRPVPCRHVRASR